MSQPILEHLALIRQRVLGASHLLVGLDYDGTLTPIVDHPSLAKLGPAARKRVKALAARPDTSVAIVSGRSLQDVQTLVDMDGLIYAGNHGLEICGRGLCFTDPTAVGMRQALGRLADALAKDLAPVPGALVENKGLTISVHYRQVAPADKEVVFRQVQAAAAVAPNRFRIGEGNQVFELRPPSDWHKGSAMGWIAGQLKKSNMLALYVGDDRTDEDAFQALGGDGITVKVGEPGETSAHYYLESPDTVREFLFWLANVHTRGGKP